MPDTIGFDTFIAVVITEFCLMALLLGVIIERSFRRAFKYLEDKDALLERISQLEEEIGYCEKHKRLNNVCDAWCPDCMDEHMLMVKKREHCGVPVLASIIEDVRQAQKGEGK